MKARTFAVLCLLAALPAWTGCKKATEQRAPAQQDRTIKVSRDDADMNAAMDRARAEVDTAITKLQAGAEMFSVKVPLSDGEHTEYFWLSGVRYRDGVFTGQIDNEPDEVRTVKPGQTVTVDKDKIADWMYSEGGKMHGNYTLRVLMKQMPPEEVAKYRRMLAE